MSELVIPMSEAKRNLFSSRLRPSDSSLALLGNARRFRLLKQQLFVVEAAKKRSARF